MQWVSRNTPKTIPRVCLPRSEPCRDLSLFPSRELWRGTLDFEVSPTYPPADNPDCGACVEFEMARRWLCVTIDNWWLIINDWLCLYLIMRMKLYWSECEKGFFYPWRTVIASWDSSLLFFAGSAISLDMPLPMYWYWRCLSSPKNSVTESPSARYSSKTACAENRGAVMRLTTKWSRRSLAIKVRTMWTILIRTKLYTMPTPTL